MYAATLVHGSVISLLSTLSRSSLTRLLLATATTVPMLASMMSMLAVLVTTRRLLLLPVLRMTHRLRRDRCSPQKLLNILLILFI